jgi:tetratricopeptide (TPR) repeat protein/class 3 adenylate cyclase
VPEAIRERERGLSLTNALNSEHRRVSVLFVRASAIDIINADQRLRDVLGRIMSKISEHSGMVARIDPFKTGHKVLCLFGAAQSAGLNELRALRAAVDIAGMSDAVVEIAVGATHGHLLCGEVGSDRRREFTVMGNAVNLAARLMAKAGPGIVLLDGDLHELINEYCFSEQERLALKGVGEAVPVFKFLHWRRERRLPAAAGRFYGRTNELTALSRWWEGATTEGPSVLEISGAAGIGKTELVLQFLKQQSQTTVCYFDGTQSALRHAGWLLGELLQTVCLDVHAESDPLVLLQAKIDQRWLPLLAPLFGEQLDDSPWTLGLSSELRLEKTGEIISGLLGDQLDNRLVIIDSIDRIDSLSQALLEKTLHNLEKTKARFIHIAQSPLSPQLPCTRLTLPPLSEKEMEQWFEESLVTGARETELMRRLTESSQGNPLLIRTTFQSLINSGSLQKLSDSVKYEVVGTFASMALHHRLEDVLLATYDALQESERAVLRSASVTGPVVSIAQLQLLQPDWSAETLESVFEGLGRKGLVTTSLAGNGAVQFAFVNRQLQESVYSRIPVLERRKWHRQLGEQLEREIGVPLVRLAYHFGSGDDAEKAFRYCFQAAVEAERNGALVEAASYFEQCRKHADDVVSSLATADGSEYYQRASAFAVHDGDFELAYAELRRWRRWARQRGNHTECMASAVEFARTLWKQSRYARCRAALRLISSGISEATPKHLVSEFLAIEGELLRRTGKIRDAQDVCTRALELAISANDRNREVTALNNLGLAFWSGGNLDAARSCFEKSLARDEHTTSLYLQGRVANNLAIISEELGDFKRARSLAERAREIFVLTGDRRNQSYASGNLANLLFQAGRYRESEELFMSADRIFQHLGEKHPHFYTVGNLGDIDLHLGRLEAAETKYNAVAQFARDCGDDELMAETAVRQADCIFYRGDSTTAETKYREALSLAEAAGSREYQIRGTVGLCRLLIGLKQVDSAAVQQQRLAEFAVTTKSDRNQHEALFLHAEIDRLRDSFEQARADLLRCRDYAREQGQFELRLKSLVRLSEQPAGRELALEELAETLTGFIESNGYSRFEFLLNSAYYRYFSRVLRSVAARLNLSHSPHPVA